MRGRGKAASNAGSSGRHAITDSTPRIPLIGPDIEAWAGDHEAQIMSTKSAREEAFLDTLYLCETLPRTSSLELHIYARHRLGPPP